MIDEATQIEMIKQEYLDLAHAMQSGVAMEISLNDSASPKHLRVGVNMALVDSGSLANLLLSKGVITELEYLTALRDGIKREKEMYERRLTERLGRPVTLW